MEPPNQRHLSSLAGKSIFGFLSLEKRKSLAKSCPATRRWQKTVPIRFEKVVIDYKSIKLDSIKWAFKLLFKNGSDVESYDSEDEDNEGNGTEDTNMALVDDRDDSLSVDEVEEQANGLDNQNASPVFLHRIESESDWESFLMKIQIPSGKNYLTNDGSGAYQRFINYYLNRRGTKIWNFEFAGWSLGPLPRFEGVSIRELTVSKTVEDYDDCTVPFMENFEDNMFDRIFLNGNVEELDGVAQQLKRMKTKSLVLITAYLDDRVFDVNFDEIIIIDRDEIDATASSEVVFLMQFREYLARSPENLVYKYDFHEFQELTVNQFIDVLKQELGFEHKYSGYHAVLALDLGDDRQLLLTCQLGQFCFRWNKTRSIGLRVEPVNRIELTPASKLSFHNRILGRIHHWQTFATCFLRNENRWKRLIKYNKPIRKYAFFLNNYHPHLLTFFASFGLSRLIFSFIPKLSFSSRPVSFLTSGLLSAAFTYRFFRSYDYDCCEDSTWDIIRFSDGDSWVRVR